jgi:alpha-1,6-mannosyltransferase
VTAALTALGALSALLYAVVAVPLVSGPGGALGVHLWVFPLVFGAYLVAVGLVSRRPPADGQWGGPLAVILAFGLLFRLMLLATPVYLSSDLYRYLWDGRVQLAGVNPYRHPPSAPELATLRDDRIHPHINRPDARTVYPPGAQGVFALAAALGVRTVPAWRYLVLAVEAATVALLLVLLRRLRVSPTAVLVYAWSPLVVFEGVQAGHLDLLVVPLALLALLWRQTGASAPAGVALGVAVLMKLYPAALAVAWSARPGRGESAGGLAGWWRSRDWGFVAAVGGTVAVGYAPHVRAVGAGALGFLPEYLGRGEDHNVGLRALLTWGIGLTGEAARGAVMTILFLVLLGTLGWIGRPREAPDFWRTSAHAVGAYLLLVPTAMHPWYVVWIVPFLCVAPSLAWLYFSGAVSLSYVAYLVAPAPLPAWAWLVQYGPLLGLLAIEARGALARRPPVAVGAR